MIATLEKACADEQRAEYKAIAARLNVEARYLPGEAFRKLFDAEFGLQRRRDPALRPRREQIAAAHGVAPRAGGPSAAALKATSRASDHADHLLNRRVGDPALGVGAQLLLDLAARERISNEPRG